MSRHLITDLFVNFKWVFLSISKQGGGGNPNRSGGTMQNSRSVQNIRVRFKVSISQSPVPGVERYPSEAVAMVAAVFLVE
jgi:hypothetical protein